MRISSKLLKRLVIMLIFALLLGCSSDDDSGPTEPENENDNPPTIEFDPIQVPQTMQDAANSGDPGAAQAVAYIQMANMLPYYTQLLTPPSSAGKLPSTSATNNEWTWTHQGATFTLTSEETATTYEMTLTVDGTIEGNTYNNQVFITASTSKLNNSGELAFYDPDSGLPVLDFEWDIAQDGTTHMLLTSHQASPSISVELYYYPDGSGALDVNAPGEGSWSISWSADGSGTWTQYDAGGGIIDQGNWP